MGVAVDVVLDGPWTTGSEGPKTRLWTVGKIKHASMVFLLLDLMLTHLHLLLLLFHAHFLVLTSYRNVGPSRFHVQRPRLDATCWAGRWCLDRHTRSINAPINMIHLIWPLRTEAWSLHISTGNQEQQVYMKEDKEKDVVVRHQTTTQRRCCTEHRPCKTPG